VKGNKQREAEWMLGKELWYGKLRDLHDADMAGLWRSHIAGFMR
jgi:hypothetical protein